MSVFPGALLNIVILATQKALWYYLKSLQSAMALNIKMEGAGFEIVCQASSGDFVWHAEKASCDVKASRKNANCCLEDRLHWTVAALLFGFLLF